MHLKGALMDRSKVTDAVKVLISRASFSRFRVIFD
jgi:hypothetical protein